MMAEDGEFSAATKESSRISKAVSVSTTSWSRLKDPRIVRVPRAFGSKDRHSKVSTVRGVRDRRVRLSVPTAIQLYDLQDRLGLNRPSKVVDWLLNEAKQAIDELPPLQIPQGRSLISSQSLHYRPMFMNESQQHPQEFLPPQSGRGVEFSSGINWEKGKDIPGEASSHRHEDWVRSQEEERSQLQLMHDENQGGFSSSAMSKFLATPSVSFSSLPNGSFPHYNPSLRWNSSGVVPQRIHEPSTSQTNNEDLRHHHNFSLLRLPSIASESHPVLAYHHASQFSRTNAEFESKQPEGFHSLELLNSSLTSPVDSDSQSVRPLGFISMTANLLPSQNSAAVGEQSKSSQFHSSS